MRAFTYQWAQETWLKRIHDYDGKPLPYCASEQFKGAGVIPGDAIYVVGLTEAVTESSRSPGLRSPRKPRYWVMQAPTRPASIRMKLDPSWAMRSTAFRCLRRLGT
jgi:hypothetical protein